jgi:hypothetical protein
MKKIFLISVLVLAAAAAIFAQSVPDGWESPTSAATGGLFTSYADDFINPSWYDGVEFEKFYAMTSFANTNKVNLGFAGKAGGLYIGAYYGGNFWDGRLGFPYIEQRVNWLGQFKDGVRVYTEANLDIFNADLPENQLSLLIGVADMGFRLSFYSQYQSFKRDDFILDAAVDQTVKSGKIESGVITPQLAWGMAKDLSENGIRPYITLDLGFNRAYQKGEIYISTSETDEMVTTSANYLEPVLGAGLGGYTLSSKDGFDISADLDYTLTLRFAGKNEYNYLDSNSDYKVSSFNGINDEDDLYETSYSNHLITPSIGGTLSKEKFEVSFRLYLNLEFENESQIPMDFKAGSTDGTLVKEGSGTKDSSFYFYPECAVAAQWQIIPKLALNIGGQITLGAAYYSNQTFSLYENDKEASSSKVISSGFGAVSNKLSLGVIFNMTDNLTFEASCGTGSGASGNGISVFASTAEGLFYFGGILVSLKF